jgi:hypothetical protein
VKLEKSKRLGTLILERMRIIIKRITIADEIKMEANTELRKEVVFGG